MVFLVLIGILVIYIVTQYNGFKKKKLDVEQARKGIDIYLKQRFDLIPNLVEVVKGAKNYEKEVLESLIKLRSVTLENEQLQEKVKLNNEYSRIVLVAETYPELKVNENFLNLSKQLSKIESQLQAARRIYNSEVTAYNTKVVKFPSNVIAMLFGFKEEKYFEISDEEKVNIKI